MVAKKFALMVAATVLVGCGGSGSGDSSGNTTGPTSQPPTSTTPPVAGSSVTVANNAFNPSAITVAPGTTVTWTWDTCDNGYPAQTCVAHSVTFDDGTTSPTKDSGTFTRAFATAGTYTYHCVVHGALMTGSVEVK